MAERSPTLALVHMLDAIEKLDEVLGTSPAVERLRANWRDRASAERMIEIISEASRRLPAAWTAGFPNLPWRSIADIGNVLRHSYDMVDPSVIVNLARGALGDLQHVVEQLLDREEPDWRRLREERLKRATET